MICPKCHREDCPILLPPTDPSDGQGSTREALGRIADCRAHRAGAIACKNCHRPNCQTLTILPSDEYPSAAYLECISAMATQMNELQREVNEMRDAMLRAEGEASYKVAND